MDVLTKLQLRIEQAEGKSVELSAKEVTLVEAMVRALLQVEDDDAVRLFMKLRYPHGIPEEEPGGEGG